MNIKAATDIKTNSIKGGTVAINSTSGSITLDNAGIEASSAVANDRDLAARIVVQGMRDGLFTGLGFSSSATAVSEKTPNFFNARRIINLLNEAAAIETQAQKYLLTLIQINF